MAFTGLFMCHTVWFTGKRRGHQEEKLVLLDRFTISFPRKSITIELQWPDDAEEAERRIEYRSGEEGGSQQCDCRFTCHFKPSPDPIIESAYSSGYPSSSRVLISIVRVQDDASRASLKNSSSKMLDCRLFKPVTIFREMDGKLPIH